MDIRLSFFEESDDALVAYDRAGRIVLANERASRFFGVPRNDLTGSTNGALCANAAAVLDPLIERAFAVDRAIATNVYPFAAGNAYHVRVTRENDLALATIHRAINDVRDLDIATQLLTFHSENSPLAVIRWNHERRIVGWSPRAQAVFGWTSADVYGKTFQELGMMYAPDLAASEQTAEEIMRGDVRSNVYETRNLTKDCRVISCRWYNSHVKLTDGFDILSLVEDVTDSVAVRRAASESEQRFRSIFDYSPDPMLALTLDGIVERANAAAADAHMLSIAEMAGRSIAEFITPEDLPLARAALKSAKNGKSSAVELTALRGQAQSPISAAFIPIVLAGRVSGVHVIVRDLTSTKRAERANAAYAQRIRELYLVSAAANATAERQIVATIEAGCRLLGMSMGALFDADNNRITSCVGETIPARLARLAIATNGALDLEDLRGVPHFGDFAAGEPPIASFIGTSIYVSGFRYGSLCFADRLPSHETFSAIDRDLIQLMGALIGSAIERGRARAHLRHLAYNDQLTSLPNRASFVERLKDELPVAAEAGTRVGVMFLDLDRFKDINDSLGHALGDRLLRIVGDRLSSVVDSDGLVARMGGDEFIIVIPSDPPAEKLADLAERIVACIDQPFEIEGYEQYVTTSVGIAIYPTDGGDADTLIKHADIAMYRAKERGRNTYQFFTPELNASLRTRLSLEKSMRKALERDEFVVYYQPQIDLSTEAIVGVEALVRWQHPRLGMVSPDQFIPSAELSGLIVALGDWVLETACRQVQQWQRFQPGLRLAVNLSARQFHQNRLAANVRATVARTGFNPDALELEITESVAMGDAALSVQIMRELREAGIRISVDDFGTGYSSLGYLRRFPLDSVKIDQSFVRDIMTEPDDATIVRTVIGMAHSLGLEVVAEGVETAEQLEFLRAERCDRVQGYFFSHPVPAVQLEPLLASARQRVIERV